MKNKEIKKRINILEKSVSDLQIKKFSNRAGIGKQTFEEITKPVMEWLKNNHHPHTMIEIDSENSVLWEGKKTCSRYSFDSKHEVVNTERGLVITESQIKELYELTGFESNANNKLKEFFPDVFKKDKVDLEVGKWYKKINPNSNTISFYTGETDEDYGISDTGNWITKQNWIFINGFDKWRIATTEEITEALTNEAVKRYKVGDCIKFLDNFVYNQTDFNKIDNINFIVSETFNSVFIESYVWNIGLFKEGKWAEIIPTITKEQAEKELNKKIID